METEFWQAYHNGKPAEFSTGATGNERITCPIRYSIEFALDDAARAAGYKSFREARSMPIGYEVRKVKREGLADRG